MRGRFITLEGNEGAGKSTQAALLADALAETGLPVLRTREPGGAPGAERLRSLLLDGVTAWSPQAEALLHFAARAEHAARSLRPALEAGMWVVCDRFFDSTMAYQGHAQGAGATAITTLRKLLDLEPDLTIMLDLDLPSAMARLASRGRPADRYERMGEGFLARVNQAFSDIAAAEPERCVVVPADGGVQTVAARVREAVWLRLTPGRPTPGAKGAEVALLEMTPPG
jgi:dTMP kinase